MNLKRANISAVGQLRDNQNVFLCTLYFIYNLHYCYRISYRNSGIDEKITGIVSISTSPVSPTISRGMTVIVKCLNKLNHLIVYFKAFKLVLIIFFGIISLISVLNPYYCLLFCNQHFISRRKLSAFVNCYCITLSNYGFKFDILKKVGHAHLSYEIQKFPKYILRILEMPFGRANFRQFTEGMPSTPFVPNPL